MGRGSQILIGVILLLLSFVLAIMASIPEERAFAITRLMGTMLTGLLGFACMFRWGRPLTMRVSLGLLSLGMVAMIVYILISDKPDLKFCVFAGFVALTSGAYAFTGYYPDNLPLACVLSQRLLPILRERFPNRGMVEGRPPDACAAFPGLHPGIRQVAVYDDGSELTVVLEDLTHGHFSDYDEAGSEADREQRIVNAVIEFLDELFADKVAVWGQHAVGGGWYRVGVDEPHGQQMLYLLKDLNQGCDRVGVDEPRGQPGVPEFLWSGPLA